MSQPYSLRDFSVNGLLAHLKDFFVGHLASAVKERVVTRDDTVSCSGVTVTHCYHTTVTNPVLSY